MITNRESDQLLVHLAQDGNRTAFDALFVRYRRQLMRQVKSLVRDDSEAEDIVQEAFISAYNSLHNFRGDSSFFTWLYRIAINSAKYNMVRSTRRLPLISDIAEDREREGFVSEKEMDLETPEALLEGQQILHLLSTAIDALPEEQREALMLREIDGMSYEEIAAAMHSPVGTVRSRVHRARDTITSAVKSALDVLPKTH